MDSYNVYGISPTPSIMLCLPVSTLADAFFLNILVHHKILIFISTFTVFTYQ